MGPLPSQPRELTEPASRGQRNAGASRLAGMNPRGPVILGGPVPGGPSHMGRSGRAGQSVRAWQNFDAVRHDAVMDEERIRARDANAPQAAIRGYYRQTRGAEHLAPTGGSVMGGRTGTGSRNGSETGAEDDLIQFDH